ncbi:OsmC family protein [Domibacillus sp. A3M-37]|uniref:OsmC family protein n=1 Tax=Domibacillus sp. A3M-37 TaxID=2962037 RepID=UPI0020B71CB4|nr:OsmC family protein [Domibacillus sp. A3M-37]MCP3764788.1 OsmC family protein [Domibacillus sp. A3M-37]
MKIRVKQIQNFQQLASANSRSVVIDQGTDRGGEDLGFRPTELWMIGLSSCSATTMTRYAKEQNYSLTGLEVHAEDRLNEQGYIEAITFQVTLEGDLSPEQKADLLEYTKVNCKLLRTVSPDIAISYEEVKELKMMNAACSLKDGSCCM